MFRSIFRRSVFSIILLFISISCATQRPQPSQISAGPNQFVIVSTNDFHATLERAEGLASLVRNMKIQYGDRMLYLDAGDQFQGSLEGNMSKGKAVVEFFNRLPLDAAAIGNHDLDYGPNVPGRTKVLPGEDGMGNLKQRVKEAGYPWLSANIVVDPPEACTSSLPCNALGQRTVFQPRVVIHRGGRRFCVIGGTTESTPNISHPGFVKGTRFEPLSKIVAAEAKWLRSREQCDCVLLLVHEGMRYETDGKRFKDKGLYSLVRNLPASTIDAVIGGHSHIRIQQIINGIPILQAGWQARVAGTLNVTFEGARPRFTFGPFVPVPTRVAMPDITKILQPYRKAASKLKSEVIGSATAAFERSTSAETALGNLIADAVLEAAKKETAAQFALMNAGGIRSELKAGPITFEDVFKVMPFDNELVVAKLNGKELLLLLQVAFSGAEGIPAVSGLNVRRFDIPSGQSGPWDRDLNQDGKKEEWERNVLAQVTDASGNQIEPDKYYLLATNSYLVHSGDYQNIVYDHVPKQRITFFEEILIRDVLVQYFRRKSPLNPQTYLSPQSHRVVAVAQ